MPVKLAGMQISAGTYTLWTVPHTASVDLIVTKQTGQWGTEYIRRHDVGTVRMTNEGLPAPVEVFTISIIPDNTRHGTVIMEWGLFRWTARIEVQ